MSGGKVQESIECRVLEREEIKDFMLIFLYMDWNILSRFQCITRSIILYGVGDLFAISCDIIENRNVLRIFQTDINVIWVFALFIKANSTHDIEIS